MVKKKSKNKGQVTLFVIIAIIFILLILVVLLIKNNLINVSNNNNQYYYYVNDCLKKNSYDSIYYVFSSGGYYYNPKESTKYGSPYYLYNSKNIMPKKELFENQMNEFVKDRARGCGLVSGKEKDFSNKSSLNVSSRIENDRINFKINYPLSYKNNGQTISFEDFNFEIDGKFDNLYNAAKEYMDKQMENSEGICINCINDIANKYNVRFVTNDFDNSTIIFNIIDDNLIVDNRTIILTYANKY